MMIWALGRKDLKLYVSDRKAMVMSIIVPIVLASFMAGIFGSAFQSNGKKPDPIRIAVADEDQSDVSRKVIDAMGTEGLVNPVAMNEQNGADSVRNGKI